MISEPTEARRPATPRVAAGALFVDEEGRIMMMRPSYKAYWEIPGGYVEEGESPRSACVREVREELGLQVDVGELLSVDWAPHPDEGDKMLFIFDRGRLTPEQLSGIRFEDGEAEEWAFVEDSRLDELTIPRLARRLRATARARYGNRSVYLELGELRHHNNSC